VTESVLASDPVVLEGLPLSIDQAEVLRFQGYKGGSGAPPAQVLALFEEARALAARLFAPRVVYRAVPAAVEAADAVRAGGRRRSLGSGGRSPTSASGSARSATPSNGG